MTDQSQTNQPKLSLEEELDVLEAVYKIGREKGLELLRPEQMKKLRDAGRINSSEYSVDHEVHRENPSLARNVAEMKRKVGSGDVVERERLIDLMIRGLRFKVENELKEDNILAKMMEKLSSGQRYYLVGRFFAYFYGVEDFELKNVLME